MLDGDYEIQFDDLNRRVWIHGPDGSTVARFDTRFGMDVHNSVSKQMEGAPQCLYCTHGQASREDWLDFREKVREHFGVEVPVDAVAI
jgi:hypothetical protein